MDKKRIHLWIRYMFSMCISMTVTPPGSEFYHSSINKALFIKVYESATQFCFPNCIEDS